MRRAAKNQMYTVVNSRQYKDGAIHTGLYGWQKALIIIDVVLALLIIGLELLIFRGYKRRKTAA